MAASSSARSSSLLNGLVGCLGGWLGLILVATGLVSLALSLLRWLSPPMVSALSWARPLTELPPEGAVIPLALGIICYIWGWGMSGYRSWAPFVAALFLLNLALYLWTSGYLVLQQIIAPPGWMLADWEIYRPILETAVVTAAALLIVLAVLLLIGPGGLRKAYVDRHQTRPAPRYKICPTCRSIIERKDGSCSWCEPRFAQATLELMGAPVTDTISLEFSRDQDHVTVGRRTADRPSTEAGYVYLDPQKWQEYGTVSGFHATFRYDNQSTRFLVEDIGSRHGTRLIRGQTATQLPEHSPQPLADGDVIELGGARFRFHIVSAETL